MNVIITIIVYVHASSSSYATSDVHEWVFASNVYIDNLGTYKSENFKKQIPYQFSRYQNVVLRIPIITKNLRFIYKLLLFYHHAR